MVAVGSFPFSRRKKVSIFELNLFGSCMGVYNSDVSISGREAAQGTPFMQVLPICSRQLDQEMFRVSGMMSNQGFGDFDRLRHRSPNPMASSNLMSNVSNTGIGDWNGLSQERLSGTPGMTMDWQGAPGIPNSYTVKRILRLEIPVDNYPNVSNQVF